MQIIQSLVRSLNFLCKAIPPGQTFLRRLIGLSSGLRRPHHKVRNSTGARLDLVTWLDFLSNFNGISVFPASEWESNDTVSLFTNASASIGYGAYFQGKWVQSRWPTNLLRTHPSIALLEFVPLYVALLCWGPLLAGHIVIFNTDNTALVEIINKKSSRCAQIM